MKTIKTYIKSKQDQFRRHSFFTKLEEMSDINEFNGFVKPLAFWPMAFQDILRLNEDRMTDEYLHKVARHHRLEDAGHERWYISDIDIFGQSDSSHKEGFDLLFDNEHTKTRDASYAILSEVFNLTDDHLRVILLLTLESTGHVFFEKTAEKVRETNKAMDDKLQYFSTHHLEVEQAHEVFEDAMERELYSIILPEDVRRAAIEMIDRVYDAFTLMFDGLVETIEEYSDKQQEHIRKEAATNEKIMEA